MPIDQRRPPPAVLLADASLFLDFDGTLVELAASPDAVVVEERLLLVLGGLGAALNGRLAIVSGRPAGQVRDFLGNTVTTIGGSHGAEMHWPDGRREQLPAPLWLNDASIRLNAFAARQPGVLVELKPFGLALHYRQAPQTETACRAIAETLAAEADIHLQHGKMVVELRAAGADKGDAVRAFMAGPRMAGTRPVFIGDDLTDEAGFAAVARLGGDGILVGPERETAATFRLDDVSATVAWLEQARENIA